MLHQAFSGRGPDVCGAWSDVRVLGVGAVVVVVWRVMTEEDWRASKGSSSKNVT